MLKLVLLSALAAVSFGGKIHSNQDEVEEYIVNGKETDISKIPYQAIVYEEEEFKCGGVILSETIVATTASCSRINDPKRLKVRVGTSFYNKGGFVYEVRNYVEHPHPSSDYNVAILELKKPLKFSKTIQPIKLATAEPALNSEVQLSGYGAFKDDWSQITSSLQSVVLRVMNRTRCRELHKATGRTVTERTFCVYNDNKDSCYMDFGGPAVAKGRLVGLISSGYQCGNKQYPRIILNIAHPEITSFLELFIKK